MDGGNQDVSITEVFQRFMQEKQAMNVSEATIRYYNKCFQYFTRFFGENKSCTELNENVGIDYILSLRKMNPNISDITINNYLRGLRAILYYFMEKGFCQSFKVSMVRAEKKLKETYTDDELEKLLKKPDIKKTSFSDYRNWVMTCYLIGTGNRASTVRNLKIGDIDFSSHEIRLKRVKNHKQYIIPLSHTLEKILIEYLQYRKGKEDDYLFCSQYGEQITYDGLSTIVSKYNLSRGVSKTSIHLFRHTFAKRWILNKGDMFRLQKILGHSTLDIVKEYVNMYGDDLQRDFDTYNPLDNFDFMKEKSKLKMGSQG